MSAIILIGTMEKLRQTIQYNCDISDARDNGIYSVCTLVLKLRNQYKWENGLQPWDEPESAVLLDWIAAKEEYWEGLRARDFKNLPVGTNPVNPHEPETVNRYFSEIGQDNLLYGAGYGRSMKAVFFLAEITEYRETEGCPVIILGRELARELASPFAMLQDGVIYIRQEALRFYFWDQIQEIRCSGKTALKHALGLYNVLNAEGGVDRNILITGFDSLTAREMEVFIYHEVGEKFEKALNSDTARQIISAFPDSPLEFVARAVKDVLADTNPKGMLGYIIAGQKESSLGFYVAFLDGLRKVLFPEIATAFQNFVIDRDWGVIDRARQDCRNANLERAGKFVDLARRLEEGESPESLQAEANRDILAPLGLMR